MDAILTRALLALAIGLAGYSLYALANRLILLRANGKVPGLESFKAGVPAVLYFTTPDCTPCRTVQHPALATLQEWLGAQVQVIRIDAAAQPETADYWGVLSVPTTFLIDAQGRPRRVNHGATRAERLLKQLEQIEGVSFRKGSVEDREQIKTAPSTKL